MTFELIENYREILKPAISSLLGRTNYEGKGQLDQEEFEKDFDELLNLALAGIAACRESGKSWKYVEKDGNPAVAGTYWVTLLYDECYTEGDSQEIKFTGKKYAAVETRYVGDITNDPVLAGWAMAGEPNTGLVWTEETGSHFGEKVWAWIPIGAVSIADLPEGYVAANE